MIFTPGISRARYFPRYKSKFLFANAPLAPLISVSFPEPDGPTTNINVPILEIFSVIPLFQHTM